MSEQNTKRLVKTQALTWLNEKPRSNEEIAEKFYEAINITYDMTKEKAENTNELKKMLWEELLKPPTAFS